MSGLFPDLDPIDASEGSRLRYPEPMRHLSLYAHADLGRERRTARLGHAEPEHRRRLAG